VKSKSRNVLSIKPIVDRFAKNWKR